MGTKNKPGKFDCYEAARPDEPMFVLLARDPLAPMLVDLWAAMRALRSGDSPKVAEAQFCADAMREWKAVEVAPSAPPPPPSEEPSIQCRWCGRPRPKQCAATGRSCEFGRYGPPVPSPKPMREEPSK